MKLVSTNPADDFAVLGEVQSATEAEVAAAVGRARQAQVSWAELSLADRCAALQSFVDVSRARHEEIAWLNAAEIGRPVVSTRVLVDWGISYIEGFIATAESHLAPEVVFRSESEQHVVVREPLGVLACIGPWNYPFCNVAWQSGQALIAGNTVVYKNSEENPLFAELLAELIAQSDLPAGVFEIVQGDGQVGKWLLEQDIDMISFTGSSATGQALARVAAEKFIPYVAELGGSAPAIVFEDGDIEATIDTLYAGRFKNCGQSCDSIKRLLVHESRYSEVANKFRDLIATKKVGNPLEEDTEIGPLVSIRQREMIEAQVQDAIDKGATVVMGASRPEGLHGAFYSPTLLTNVSFDMRVWHEEVFGPVLPIVSFSTEEEAIRLANDTPYGLGARVITQDDERFARVARQIKSGMVVQNNAGYSSPETPFGGYKKSGLGRQRGQAGFHAVTQIKVIGS